MLEEKHQQTAIEIVQKHRTKKSCNKCYDRGYIGFSPDKTIIPCEKCVDMEKAYEEWKNYVAQDEQLKDDYKELFVEEETESTEESTETEQKDSHAPTAETKPKKQGSKKEGGVRKDPHLKTAKSTTVRKSGNR